MAIALVQSASGNSPTGRPVIAPSSPVGAGHLLVLVAVSLDMNGIGSQLLDAQGNAYNMFSGDQSNNQSCSALYARNSGAGSGALTIPTDAPCAWAIHEFSGVLAASDPFSNAGSASLVGTNITVPYVWDQSNELFFAVMMANQKATFTTAAGSSLAQAQSSDNGSLQTWWLQTNRITSSTRTFTANVPASTCAYWATFLHA